MKKFVILSLVLLWGCTTASIPYYLPSKKPYVKRFYVNYDTALAGVKQLLKDTGWEIAKTTDPADYEANRTSDLDEKQALLITEIRQTPFVLGTRYARMNIYLRSKKELSEFEIRYLTISSTSLKTIKDYSNDSEVKRLLVHLEEILNRAPAPKNP